VSGQIDTAVPVERSIVRLTPLFVTGMGTAAAAGVGVYAVAAGGTTEVALVATGVVVVGLLLLALQFAQLRRHNMGRASRVRSSQRWFGRRNREKRPPSRPNLYGPNATDSRAATGAGIPDRSAPWYTVAALQGPPEPPADESATRVIPVGARRVAAADAAAHTPPSSDLEPTGAAAPDPLSPQIEPSVFAGGSAAGQARWHLSKGFAPPGLSADGLRLGDVDARAASVVGPGHRCQEPAIARQDAYLLRRTDDGRHLIVAVADGVSQSRRADLGARLAVSAAARGVAEVLDGGRGIRDIDPVAVFTAVAGEMVGTARNQSHELSEIYAILVAAVIPTQPEPDGRRTMWTAQIGDVSVWVLRSGSLTRRTGPAKAGMDKNTLEFVLPTDPGAARAALIELQPGDTVAVMTDGLSESLVNIAGVADFFSGRWACGPPHPATFLHELCYDAPGQADDRTVVTAWVGATDQDTGHTT
jgi:hypothetical protein